MVYEKCNTYLIYEAGHRIRIVFLFQGRQRARNDDAQIFYGFVPISRNLLPENFTCNPSIHRPSHSMIAIVLPTAIGIGRTERLKPPWFSVQSMVLKNRKSEGKEARAFNKQSLTEWFLRPPSHLLGKKAHPREMDRWIWAWFSPLRDLSNLFWRAYSCPRRFTASQRKCHILSPKAEMPYLQSKGRNAIY